jgi:hypothetical protein
MRIGGIEIKGPNEEILVLPRLDEDIVIKAQAVTTMDEFDVLVPEPKPPGIRTRDGWKPNANDESFKQRMTHYNEQRLAYMIIKSVEPSNIEWGKTDISDPSTYTQWTSELKEAGLSDVEVNRIVLCVMQANSLDEEKLKAAREVFLLGKEEEQKASSGLSIEQPSTSSGEPVSG